MRYLEPLSRKAVWSFRLALLSILVFAGAFIWHRFLGLQTPLALKIFGAAIAAAIVSFAVAVAALVTIWNEGHKGAGRASGALFLSALVLAVPLWSLPALLTLPRIYEVTTDRAAPPAFDRIGKIFRQGQANPAHYETSFAALQAAAYPDLKPLLIQRSVIDVYSAVRDVIKALKWKVIDEQAPDIARSGHIEAVDRTLIFGFNDDISIRVTGSAKAAKVDVRSSSRFGQHDLGRNAARIRHFQSEVKLRLAELERLDRMEHLMAAARDKDKAKGPAKPQAHK